ncbi:anti-sigma factor antagonist [Candidatus Riflebacteria bacterium]
MASNLSIEHQFSEDKNVLLVTPVGHLDHLNSYSLFDYVEDVRKGSEVKQIVFLLEKTNYIGSRGFGIILKLGETLKKEAGEVILAEAQPYILDTFMMMGLGRVVKYFNSRKDALEYFSLKSA